MSRQEKTSKPNEVEYSYNDTITYTCPTRGQVTQIVKVTRYKSVAPPDKLVPELEILKELDDLYEPETD